MPFPTEGLNEFVIERDDVDIFKKTLIVVARRSRIEARTQVDADGRQSAGNGAGTPAVHSQYDNNVFFGLVHFLIRARPPRTEGRLTTDLPAAGESPRIQSCSPDLGEINQKPSILAVPLYSLRKTSLSSASLNPGDLRSVWFCSDKTQRVDPDTNARAIAPATA